VIFLAENLPAGVTASSLLERISFWLDGRDVSGMECINDLDGPILDHDFSDLADPPLVDSGEVVPNLEGTALLIGQFHLNVMLMCDYVLLVLEIL
jgi:hypothetical protein